MTHSLSKDGSAKKGKTHPTQQVCNHLWNYVHAVYGGPKGGTCIRRYCDLCTEEQVGVVERWRDPHPDEFDETAKEAIEYD